MNYQLGNLEFRVFRENDAHRPPEIVVWDDNIDGSVFCYTVLWWIKGKEGYHIEFVGKRPLELQDSKENLWKLMEYGTLITDALFLKEQEN